MCPCYHSDLSSSHSLVFALSTPNYSMSPSFFFESILNHYNRPLFDLTAGGHVSPPHVIQSCHRPMIKSKNQRPPGRQTAETPQNPPKKLHSVQFPETSQVAQVTTDMNEYMEIKRIYPKNTRTLRWGAVWPPACGHPDYPRVTRQFSSRLLIISNVQGLLYECSFNFLLLLHPSVNPHWKTSDSLELSRLLELSLSHQVSVLKPSFAYKEQKSISSLRRPFFSQPPFTSTRARDSESEVSHAEFFFFFLQKPMTYPMHVLPRSSPMLSFDVNPILEKLSGCTWLISISSANQDESDDERFYPYVTGKMSLSSKPRKLKPRMTSLTCGIIGFTCYIYITHESNMTSYLQRR